ncbi:MAG: mechanosensitive ion channel family protein [Muribaculaceae bacterium]|nr:mechanosensitive ion channel family protein [Muribaculaceae bacterium]
MLLTDIIPSHTVARWLLGHIHKILDFVGLDHNKTLVEIVYVAVIILVAILIGWILSNLIRVAIRKVIMVRNPGVGEELVRRHVLSRCSHIIPPLFVLALLPFALTGQSTLNTVIYRATFIYTTIVICVALCSVVTFTWTRFEEKRNTRNLPLRGILDTIIGIIWVITLIICVAILVDKSPAVLLGGLGAFAAVLMLVFKDSILGLVGGLQLSQNDMLHVGDWIVVPSTPANGIVIDASLTTIKVQNWDNTIVTIPPYTLVSGSFQNWRGMSDSGVRQIAREILFDAYSITPLAKADLDRLVEKYPIVKPYVDKVMAAGHLIADPGLATVNGSITTNMGLFRAYMCQWLIDNPGISKDNQILVRLMAPTEYGVPLQIWCFTAINAWTAYEAIQSDVFEHIITTSADFGLRVYNETSGMDALTVNIPGLKTQTPPSQATQSTQG